MKFILIIAITLSVAFSATNTTNPMAVSIGDFLNGYSVGLDLGVSQSDIQKCAQGKEELDMSLVPIFQDIFEKNYESAIEDLGEKIPELESEWDECDVYNAAFLDKVLIPIYDQFEENPEETLETLGLNLLENFNTLKSDFNLIKSDIESMKFYDAGLKEGSLITTLFNGIIPKNNYTTFFDIEA